MPSLVADGFNFLDSLGYSMGFAPLVPKPKPSDSAKLKAKREPALANASISSSASSDGSSPERWRFGDDFVDAEFERSSGTYPVRNDHPVDDNRLAATSPGEEIPPGLRTVLPGRRPPKFEVGDPASLDPSLRNFKYGAPVFLTKLEVGSVDDPLERQADEIADEVMRMPAPTTAELDSVADQRPLQGSRGLVAQRQCASCEAEEDEQLTRTVAEPVLSRAWSTCADEDNLRRTCASCDAEDELLRAHASCAPDAEQIRREPGAGLRGGGVSDSFAAHVRGRLRLGGSPLSSGVRGFLEPRLGVDLERVRVHADMEAGTLARKIAARAFTFGKDIFFAPGELRPQTHSGMRLLAHEVAHTLQQNQATFPDRSLRSPLTVQRKIHDGRPASAKDPWRTKKLRLWLDERRGGTLGDDRARAIVNRWTEQSDEEFVTLTVPERAHLIGQLAARIVGARDERAILALLEDDVSPGDVWEMLKDIDRDRLVKRFRDKKPYRQRNDPDVKTHRERLQHAIHAGEREGLKAGELSLSLVETNCTFDEAKKAKVTEGYSDALAAIDAARVELEAARSDGESTSNKALMSLRMVMGVRGTPSPDVLDMMAKKLTELYNVSYARMKIVCETAESSESCDMGARAFVHPDKPYEIHVCQQPPPDDLDHSAETELDVRDITNGLVKVFLHELTHKINKDDGAKREDGLSVFPDIYLDSDTFWLVSQMPGDHQFNNPDHMALFVLAAAGMMSEEQVAEKMKDPRAEPEPRARITDVPKDLEAALRPIGNRARLWVQQAHKDLELVLGKEPQGSGPKARRKNTKSLLEKDGWGATDKAVKALLSFIEPIHTVFEHDFILETKDYLDNQAKAQDTLNHGGVLLTPGLEDDLGKKLLKGGSDAPELSDFGVLTQQVESILDDWMIDAIERSRGAEMSDEELRQIPQVVEFLRKNFEVNALLADWPGLE